ncbi:phosphoenolpyruvate mutase [Candidatus Pacearchaeota archaeon]|nr:phosphoenolpyruvate mutase [Candidatus Pacearchaeota archaeon]|tara:strand:+ start:12501 stop:13796 length:1296 start_codon:yes stop_codon:yes gene_type:complete
MKSVYLAVSEDIIHPGNLNMIQVARGLGRVTVGLLTDEAIASYKRLPFLTYDQRKNIVENIKGVDDVIPQTKLDYADNLRKLKPDFVIHRNVWETQAQRNVRKKILEVLNEYGGQLMEPDYQEALSPEELKESLSEFAPHLRRGRLRRLINSQEIVRILEAHSGLTGLIVENSNVDNDDGGKREFDGVWISSLTDSLVKGMPDIGVVDFTSRLNTIHQILEVTTKPIILDGDNGGLMEHFGYMVKTLERLGVSAVIIEDKVGLKKNSLFGKDVEQNQDSIEEFSNKISHGKRSQKTDDFMVIARIESLILGVGVEDALTRAEAYIKAGADAVMIHSKEKEPVELMEFCKRYKEFENRVPLIAVPSTYSHMTEEELRGLGINVIIYANHLLRSAYPAMKNAAEKILQNSRAQEADENCMPIKEILELIPGGK